MSNDIQIMTPAEACSALSDQLIDANRRIMRHHESIQNLVRMNEQQAREIRYLRQYGNKDATAQADAAMATGEMEKE